MFNYLGSIKSEFSNQWYKIVLLLLLVSRIQYVIMPEKFKQHHTFFDYFDYFLIFLIVLIFIADYTCFKDKINNHRLNETIQSFVISFLFILVGIGTPFFQNDSMAQSNLAFMFTRLLSFKLDYSSNLKWYDTGNLTYTINLISGILQLLVVVVSFLVFVFSCFRLPFIALKIVLGKEK